jgi:hypothetical protein
MARWRVGIHRQAAAMNPEIPHAEQHEQGSDHRE